MKIAVIGSGISGLCAAYLLAKEHTVVLYEASDKLGGHTATIPTMIDGNIENIDTGFIVYNDWTYPNFIELMQHLNIASKPTEMGFSVTTLTHDFEYCGTTIARMFAHKPNFFNPAFYRMLKDIVAFNKRAKEDIQQQSIKANLSLTDYLKQGHYGRYFLEYYIIPMASAIWSCSGKEVGEFQALFFIQFFFNHGLLNINQRPQWRVINEGSFKYIEPITAPYKDNIRLNQKVEKIKRHEDYVEIITATNTDRFDYVVLATHSDQALALLEAPSLQEQNVLGVMGYRDNAVTMHTDTKIMPKARAAWTSWNYLLDGTQNQQPVLTYHMNTLQSLTCKTDVLVTVNGDAHIDQNKILHQFTYAHPQLTQSFTDAQKQWDTINNKQRTLYCGAYWRNGFHEDGVYSARRAVESIGGKWL